jgi:hypothetical protein
MRRVRVYLYTKVFSHPFLYQTVRLLTDADYAAKMWSVFQMEQWIGFLNLIRVAAAVMVV